MMPADPGAALRLDPGRGLFVARSAALNAAQSGVNAQRLYGAPNGAGKASATRFLAAAGGWLVGWEKTGPSCVITDTEPR